MQQSVVLVDQQDRRIGLLGKLEAHQGVGQLHRAISVLLYRGNGRDTEVLLQRRSKNKPLWPLFWSNTVCTHPQDKEGYIACGERRLQEELGISLPARALRRLFRFEYQARYDRIFCEHEMDTVVVGEYSGGVSPDPDEVAEFRWVPWKALVAQLKKDGSAYTPWLRIIAKEIEGNRRYKKQFILTDDGDN